MINAETSGGSFHSPTSEVMPSDAVKQRIDDLYALPEKAHQLVDPELLKRF